ncbi:MAG: hypothetical protein IPF62_16745 [Bacteroidetes bacterium]|jgi:hypothetical protein|nr:hypothetical protein [Bacteroidota bacterium]MBK7039794.1 hypothetical protein [Bacteroidota bacterium]MBK9299370.1 hypothetical protein [Bacteroidota bacterium]
MKKVSLIIICLLILFESCKHAKQLDNGMMFHLYGYANDSYVFNDKVDFGEVDPKTSIWSYKANLLKFSLVFNQAVSFPNGEYLISTPYDILNGMDSCQLFRINTINNIVDSFNTNSKHAIHGLMYSPTYHRTYAIEEDSIFEFILNEQTQPKTMNKVKNYPGLHLGNVINNISSTAHGYLPYLYVANSDSTIRKLDVSTGIYSNIYTEDSSVYSGIRYNSHDSMIYILRSKKGQVELMKLNPITNILSKILAISGISQLNTQYYSTAINFISNEYVLYMDNYFYIINLDNHNMETRVSNKIYQGLIGVNTVN